MKTLRVELTAEGKSLAEAKIQMYIPGSCTITIIICNSDDATQPYTHKMHKRIQI